MHRHIHIFSLPPQPQPLLLPFKSLINNCIVSSLIFSLSVRITLSCTWWQTQLQWLNHVVVSLKSGSRHLLEQGTGLFPSFCSAVLNALSLAWPNLCPCVSRAHALLLRLFDADHNLVVLMLNGGGWVRVPGRASLNRLSVFVSHFHLPGNFPGFSLSSLTCLSWHSPSSSARLT